MVYNTEMETTETNVQKDFFAETKPDEKTECKMCKFVLVFAACLFVLTLVFVIVLRMENPPSPSAPVLPNERPAAVNIDQKGSQLEETAAMDPGVRMVEVKE